MSNGKITDEELSQQLLDKINGIADQELIKDITAQIDRIKGYLGKIYFNTVADMVAASASLKLGDNVQTYGYYEIDDGGGANYVIGTEQYDWSIALTTTEAAQPVEETEEEKLFANINEPTEVNYKQFGAFLDGIKDDYEAMLLTHAYADSIYTYDKNKYSVTYNCTVANHSGIIYKQGTKAIICYSNIDLSGSTLLVDNTNASWFGIYLWGNASSLYWDYEIQEDIKPRFTPDNYIINLPSNDELPDNAILKLEEIPYSVRDDSGYLYSVGRRELFLHNTNGILSTPFGDDWTHAGGEEINCDITNLEDSTVTTSKVYSVLNTSYSFMPSRRSTFTGCEVILDMDANKYCSVLTVKNHNSLIQDFYFKPNKNKLHNTAFKNAMLYVFDSYNVIVRNIQGLNASGKMEGSEKGTSGYMLRMTNCADVSVEDCRMNGYWGCSAMDSVKNIHFTRCHMNRLDVHDYFYNLTAIDCIFYHHAIQIGYGRGKATFIGCSFYYNEVPYESYPEAYAIALNLTYGRIFEGILTLDNCHIHVMNPPDNMYSLIEMYFTPKATAITDHFRFPEIRCKNIHIYSPSNDIEFSYVRIGGTRNAKTSYNKPSHIYEQCDDNTVKWKYIGRAFNWGQDATTMTANVGDLLRIFDTALDEDEKTLFYNWRYYKCTTAGSVSFGTKPAAYQQTITVGSAIFEKIEDPNWKSKYNYGLGDIIMVATSNFYQPYMYKCIQAGTSNGYYPTHTSGTVLEGTNDPVNEPDLCWWTYIAPKTGWITEYQVGSLYSKGTRIIVEGRMYEVTKDIVAENVPPFKTPWLKEFDYSTGRLKYIGNTWKPKKWYEKGSYCEANGRIYQLSNHDGTTTGTLPTRGNKYCVDGDIIWEYVGEATPTISTLSTGYLEWQANTYYDPLALIKVDNRIYEVQTTLTGSSEPIISEVGTEGLDGNTPVKYYGEHPLAWRTAGATYKVGDIISDNTFLCICTQGGVSNISNKWGPLESAAWGSNGKFIDNECIWEKLTPTKDNGVWRNGNASYPVGTFMIVTSGESNMKIYEVIKGKSSSTAPTVTTGGTFINGTLTLAYKGEDTGDGGTDNGGGGTGSPGSTWLANTRYNIGDTVTTDTSIYQCKFDGRLVLPNKSVFENISTNLTKGYAFSFNNNVNVPTRKGDVDWKVLVRNCDGIVSGVKGLPSGSKFFGGTNTIDPSITIE